MENLAVHDPDNVNVLYNLGMCYSQLGSIDKSIETLEICVRLAEAFLDLVNFRR